MPTLAKATSRIADNRHSIWHDPENHDVRAFDEQAANLAQHRGGQSDDVPKQAGNGKISGGGQAHEAKFVTPLDPVVETRNGGRLPVVPVHEATKLNHLKANVDGRLAPPASSQPPPGLLRSGRDGNSYGSSSAGGGGLSAKQSDASGAPLRNAIPPSRTHPLFPPLPMYGPPSPMRTIQCWIFQLTSAFLSLAFLLCIFGGTVVSSIPRILGDVRRRAMLQNPRKRRPFYREEVKRRQERRAAEKVWSEQQRRQSRAGRVSMDEKKRHSNVPPQDGEFVPTEGGRDPLVVDVAYYARRVGLDAETYEVQTEDGYIIELWHLFNPRETQRAPAMSRKYSSPTVFADKGPRAKGQPFADGKKKYPVLMVHGLLQAAGAFCSNDDDSLAFYLAKSGYDVWLGNNRCGFEPKHTMLDYSDPRMWAWNIRQMGVMDLPAMISRVLEETGFPKLALIAHSQGTTQTFVALAKEQRPDIGEKISVFCALAPAVYAGPLVGKIYFIIMRLINPALFRLIFGIHAFIPLMALAHRIMPPKPYSWLAYHVFSHLFGWSDVRWERDLRDRMFQWAPTYVSAESMRWWLGRECFATQRCILATREEGRLEDREDEEDDEIIRKAYVDREPHVSQRRKLQRNLSSFRTEMLPTLHPDVSRGRFAWYDDRFPPLALWVCGADNLVDGRRLLRRLDRGREPHVRIVHKKLIEGYEHLDVIWAMDAIEKVGKEVREVIWRTAEPQDAARCRVPVGCELPLEQDPDLADDVPMLHSGGRLRMASISEAGPPNIHEILNKDRAEFGTSAKLEASWEVEGEHDHLTVDDAVFHRRLSAAHFTDLQEKENPLA